MNESKSKIHVCVRWATRRYMPSIVAIEHASHEFPLCEEEILEILRQRNQIGMVAERNDEVLGFMLYRLEKKHIHVIDLAVDPRFRRRGVGTQMVDKLKGKLAPDRRTRLAMTARETNLDGQLFLRKMGFRATAVERQSFEDSKEDGYVMEYGLESRVLVGAEA